MLQLGEEALDQVALAVELLAEAGFPVAVALRREDPRGTLVPDQFADAVSIVSFVSQHDRVRVEVVEQRVGDLAVVCLARCQAEPDRESLCVDDDVDLGQEPAA